VRAGQRAPEEDLDARFRGGVDDVLALLLFAHGVVEHCLWLCQSVC